MDDMRDFERQVEQRIQRFAGPVRAVDDLAILDAVISASRSRRWGWTMVAALGYAAAVIVVALFGGVLLMGVLIRPDDEAHPGAATDAPSPMTTEQLLSGMVTEEVGPGVFRVVDDGHRDPGARHGVPDLAEAVVVDRAGGVWRVTPDRDEWSGTYYRLGAEEEWRVEPGSPESDELGLAALSFKIAPDGRLVVGGSEVQRLFREGSLTPEELGWDGPYGTEFGFADDGTLWLFGSRGDLMRVPPEAAPEVIDRRSAYDGEFVGSLSLSADGEVWLAGRRQRSATSLIPIDVLLHFQNGEWETVPIPGESALQSRSSEFDVGPDGTLWTAGDSTSPHRRLARYDGTDWTVFGEVDGVRPWGGHRVEVYGAPTDMLRVAPDGAAWVNAADPGEWGYGGLARYDGKTWSSYLPGMCVTDYDFAPEGAVWVVAAAAPVEMDEDTLVAMETYVIPPGVSSATKDGARPTR